MQLLIMKGLVTPVSFLIGIATVLVLIILMDSFYIPPKWEPHIKGHSASFLLDLPGFDYLINNQICNESNKSDIRVIMIITSHAGNVATRQAHRTALPKDLLTVVGVRRVFLLAVASTESSSHQYSSIKQQLIYEEDNVNGDLIQGNFNEAYRNLTYKHMMGLQWVSKYCSSVKYVIKMDDDIILDIFQLLKALPQMVNDSNQFLLGYLLKGMKPIRDPLNKWFVSMKEYPKTYYPPFLSGWMYVTTPEIVSRIVRIAQEHRSPPTVKDSYLSFFWIDDVFVTGILSGLVGAKLIDFSRYFGVHPQYFQCCVEANVIGRAHKSISDEESLLCDYVVGPSGGDMDLLMKFMEDAKKCWIMGELCIGSTNSTHSTKTCVVGRGGAYDWVRRPFKSGEAILKTIKL
ncbi:beta-1,3-galactosyltransferase 5 [Ischnura elegans]|uniref:beta-1,3-galactosyltransferase 5 n=1 Tax=Ischnura elegans TaxID=197161 RepID=UPI001ED8829F|nr:beta-1,3-galactosyltransferase 5 [Ischnura elegans]